MPILTRPFLAFLPLYYLLGELASLLVVQIPIHSCPWSANNCPHPLLVLPSFHAPHIKLQYLHRRHEQCQRSSSGAIRTIPSGYQQHLNHQDHLNHLDHLKYRDHLSRLDHLNHQSEPSKPSKPPRPLTASSFFQPSGPTRTTG
jgi:hypothetical protein